MTVSASNRPLKQLWSDLLVALGGSEAFLTRDLSERQVMIEILNTFGGSYSKRTIGGRENILARIVTAAGGTASPRHGQNELLAALVTALGGTAPPPYSSSISELLAAAVNAADTGGGGGYSAHAVHFDGTKILKRADVLATVSDGGNCTFSGWLKTSPMTSTQNARPLVGYAEAGAGTTVFGSNITNLGVIEFDGDDHDGTYGSNLLSGVGNYTFEAWVHVLVSVEVNHGSGSKLGAIYLNDVKQTTTNPDSLAYEMGFSVADYWAFGGDGLNVPSFICDAADWQLFPNVSIVESGNTISEVHRRLFIGADGKPVDPAVAAAALGQPAVLLSGNTDGFIVNQGYGGPFSLVNGKLTAAISPALNAGAGSTVLENFGWIPVGTVVTSVHNYSLDADVSADFESAISVAGQIVQTGSSDYSSDTVGINLALVPGSLTNATTSPSD